MFALFGSYMPRMHLGTDLQLKGRRSDDQSLFSSESLRQTHSGKGLPSLSLQSLRLSASMEHPLKAVAARTNTVLKRNMREELQRKLILACQKVSVLPIQPKKTDLRRITRGLEAVPT